MNDLPTLALLIDVDPLQHRAVRRVLQGDTAVLFRRGHSCAPGLPCAASCAHCRPASSGGGRH